MHMNTKKKELSTHRLTDPPTPQFVSNGLGCWRFKRWDENTAQRAMGLNAVGDRIDDRIHPRSEISS